MAVVTVIMLLVIPFGTILISVATMVPAVNEQIRLDPCSAYDTTVHLSNRGAATSFTAPRWGTPRHQSLSSPPQTIPTTIKRLYLAAAARYKIPWQLLAGIGMAETRHGRNHVTSSAGAQGLMQFMPGTFATFGIDGDGDATRNIRSNADSIFSAGHYLVASGVRSGSAGVIKALWAYNRSITYRNDVLYYAWSYAGKGGIVVQAGDDSSDPKDCIIGDLSDLPGFDGNCPKSGSAAERGLRPTALHGLRCVKAAFPAIVSMGGKGGRPIGTSDHPRGLAVDFMIPKWSTTTGKTFGWQAAKWVAAHAKQLRVKYIIWDVTKWNPQANGTWRPYRHPLGNSSPTLAHRDHIHVSFLTS